MGTPFWLNCQAISLIVTYGVSPGSDVHRRVDCIIEMMNSWTSNYGQIQYLVFVDPERKLKMKSFKLKLDRKSIEHRRPTITSNAQLECFLWFTPEEMVERNSAVTGDLRRFEAHVTSV